MKQHYIPRCYLRRFSDKEKSIATYDKKNCRKYNASLMSVCCEDDLYTISDSYVEETNKSGKGTINGLSIEKDHFSRGVEPLFAQLLNQIDEIKEEWISGKDNYRLNFEEKREIALHLVTQFFRMPEMGETMVDDYLRADRASIDMIKEIMAAQTGNEAFRNLEVETICEKPALHASLSYMDGETMGMFADAIAENIFVFRVSKGNDFYTSDVPIVVEPHVPNARPLYMGLAQYGGEVTFPLSPGLSLSIYDRDYFKDKEELDCAFVVADDKEVRRHNYLRYFYAIQHVFSYKNDFSLIEMIYKLKGKHYFCKPNFRMEIVSGLGRY